MKTTITIISLSAILAGLPLLAQESPRPAVSGLAERFKQFDKNGDGKLTPEEFGQPGLFKALDPDGDGVLTSEEVKAFAGKRATPGATSKPDAPANVNRQPVARAGMKTQFNVRYAQRDGVEAKSHSLDVYTPLQATNAPVIVFIHGGNLHSGDKADVGELPAWCERLGYMLVSINYRLSPPDKHPAHVQDTATALAWVQNHIAEHGGDPRRMIVWGYSAGALLATLVSTDHRRLQAEGKDLSIIRATICLDSAAYDLAPPSGARTMDLPDSIPSRAFGNDPALLRDGSPIHNVAPGKHIPPHMIFVAQSPSAGGDRKLKIAETMGETLRAAGVRAEIVHAPFRSHQTMAAELGKPNDPIAPTAFDFIKAILDGAPGNPPLGKTTELTLPGVTAESVQRKNDMAAARFLIKRLDKNGDGKVTRDEMTSQFLLYFPRLDKNKDGAITVEEQDVKSTEPPRATPAPKDDGALFDRVRIPGLTDIHEGMNGFALADLNRDGLTDIVATYSPPMNVVAGRTNKLRVFLNRGGLRFERYPIQITGSSHTDEDFGRLPEIPNLVDFNGDGFLDILVTRTRGRLDRKIHPGGNTLLVSQGAFDRFADLSAKMGIQNPEGYNRQTSIGDINGDGWLDIAIGCDCVGSGTRGSKPLHRLYVFRPNGPKFEDGKFEDIGGTDLVPDFGGPYTGNPNKDRSGPCIALRDLDNDGDLDLVQSYHIDSGMMRPTEPATVHQQKFGVWCWKNLLRETGQLRFEKVTGNGLATEGQMKLNRDTGALEALQHSISLPYIAMADVDNDGLMDILAVGPSSPAWHIESDPIAGRFWHNLGGFRLEDRTHAAGLDAINWTKRQWHQFWGVTTPTRLLEPPRVKLYPMTGLPTKPHADHSLYYSDVVFGDFDNDGWVDFVLCNRSERDAAEGVAFNVLFLNQGDGTFKPTPITFSGLKSIGICGEVADLNNDGLLDLIFAADPDNSSKDMPPESYESVVYLNTGAHGARANYWLRLRFSGVKDAELIGARVEVTATGMKQYRWIHSNHSYKSGGALEAHFGLGQQTKVDVKVTLPSGKMVAFAGAKADHFLDLNLATSLSSLVSKEPKP
jgi:acetyl esterase/lipase